MNINLTINQSTIAIIHYPSSSLDIIELPNNLVSSEHIENYIVKNLNMRINDVHWEAIKTINILKDDSK